MSRKSRRKKYIPKNKKKSSAANDAARSRRFLIIAAVVIIAIVATVIVSYILDNNRKNGIIDSFEDRAALIKSEALSSDILDEIGENPAGEDAEYAVFLSLSDGSERANIFSGTGKSLDDAWSSAYGKADAFVKERIYDAAWLKADVVNSSQSMTDAELSSALSESTEQYFRYGLALKPDFSEALLEEELNCAKIYDYENHCIDFEYLNKYLQKAGRATVSLLGGEYTAFTCVSWFCGNDGKVLRLQDGELSYGRRSIDPLDADFARAICLDSSKYLEQQLKEDGSFIYGYKPRFDNEISGYNILRHAGSIWTLVIRYEMTGDEALIPKIESAIDYVIDNALIYSDDGESAYVFDADDDEIKLGGDGIMLVALTEYMEALDTDKYMDIAALLGNGILSMLDQSTGKYTHVLNPDLSVKEEFRTVYYDGEASFALCRLYGMTKDEKWLSAAESAVGNFIREDYTKYRDHWIAYTMNELTKYVKNEEYFTFALRNAQENLDRINRLDRTAPTCLELLMATYEVYERIIDEGISVGYLNSGFDLDYFLDTILNRADAQLDGYFFPEYAMYMRDPAAVLNAFFAREDGFRTRIDDTQHSVGGYYLYYLHYDRLLDLGMAVSR